MNATIGRALDAVILPMLLVDTMLLALLELFFLPLRFDGTLLPDLGGSPAPVTILVAALTTPLLVSQTARCSARMGMPRGFASLPLLLWVLTVIVVGALGPGKDKVLVADWRALVLIAAGALPSAFVLGRALGGAHETQRIGRAMAGAPEDAKPREDAGG